MTQSDLGNLDRSAGIPALFFTKGATGSTSISGTYAAAGAIGSFVLEGLDMSVIADPGSPWSCLLQVDDYATVMLGSGKVLADTLGTYIPWRGFLLIPSSHYVQVFVTCNVDAGLALVGWGRTFPEGEGPVGLG